MISLLGLSLAFLLRSTAGAISAVLRLIFVPGIFGEVLPDAIRDNVIADLPADAGDNVTNAASWLSG